MGEANVARERDMHGAIGKARAAAALIDILHDGDNYLQIPYTKMAEEQKADMRDWMHVIAIEALERALDEIEAEQKAAALSPESPEPEPPAPEDGPNPPRLHVVKTGRV